MKLNEKPYTKQGNSPQLTKRQSLRTGGIGGGKLRVRTPSEAVWRTSYERTRSEHMLSTAANVRKQL